MARATRRYTGRSYISFIFVISSLNQDQRYPTSRKRYGMVGDE